MQGPLLTAYKGKPGSTQRPERQSKWTTLLFAVGLLGAILLYCWLLQQPKSAIATTDPEFEAVIEASPSPEFCKRVRYMHGFLDH
jgi:hypothetical protein